ncbi:hypothetical protein IFM89_014999 [Coptis chinensis]|uniref:Uncharacterized protein n=1 Tax=Coptis chinensis TaxID=261450 RepID=A0A835LRQ0_9MAGN|nr:hypothetical protein IFM89_014999 [Coptis chinensis]
MKRHAILLVLLLLYTLLLVCFGAESEIKVVDPKSRNEQNNTLTSKETLVVKPSGSKPVSVEDKKKNVHGTDNLSKDPDSKEVPKVGTGKDDSIKKPHVKDGNKKEGTDDGSGSKMVPNGLTTEGNSVATKPTKKESVRGEECDSSSTCKDEINKLVACLRVPGDGIALIL